MTSADELEQAYRRIYRRLVVGMFVVYAVVFAVGVTVLVSGTAMSWRADSARPHHIEAAMIKE